MTEVFYSGSVDEKSRRSEFVLGVPITINELERKAGVASDELAGLALEVSENDKQDVLKSKRIAKWLQESLKEYKSKDLVIRLRDMIGDIRLFSNKVNFRVAALLSVFAFILSSSTSDASANADKNFLSEGGDKSNSLVEFDLDKVTGEVITNNEHISCDGWASCFEGEICVHNPEAIWADGTKGGNWVCQDEATYPYELVACPEEVGQELCAVEKSE